MEKSRSVNVRYYKENKKTSRREVKIMSRVVGKYKIKINNIRG